MAYQTQLNWSGSPVCGPNKKVKLMKLAITVHLADRPVRRERGFRHLEIARDLSVPDFTRLQHGWYYRHVYNAYRDNTVALRWPP